MGRRRIARVVALAMMMTVVGAGSAAAAAPAGNAAFVRAGVQVYPENAVGVGCRALGFCSGVAGELAESATPRYLSLRAGEPVLVTCRSADLAKVVGFFGRGEDLITGWSDTGGLQMRSTGGVPACGPLS